MDARFYNSEDLDIQQLANSLENAYRAQGYQIQQVGNRDQMMIQLKKGGDFETLIGMGVALSVIIQHTSGGVMAMIGQQKWMDKAAAGAMGVAGLVFLPLLPLAVTAGVGALRQMSLANQVLNMVDGLVRQQRPGLVGGPIPAQLIPQFQQQWAPPAYSPAPLYTPPVQYIPQPPPVQYIPSPPVPQPAPMQAPSRLRCSTCNTPYDSGDEFCSGCGKSLVAPKTLCPHCKTELKSDDASFCPNCGASVFQTFSATQAAMPAPAAPKQPPTPTYTPPLAPTQASQPRPAAPPQPETYYVPSVPQEPPVMPQPKVTMTPATPKQEAPAAPKQPPTPLYTPPVAPKAMTPQPPKPIAAKPTAEPAFDPNATWGNLTFSDGQQVKLVGERAVVGRYDHDLGGINPEVDLATMQEAETVSRVHAAIEHIGSSFTLMDLNSTNATRINGKRLEPDKPTAINEGDTLQFGKVTCTFKKV